MCATCGCDSKEEVKLVVPGDKEVQPHHHHHHDHGDHHHDHVHDHGHHHHHGHTRHVVDLEQDILLKNNLLAERNRGFFDAKGIVAFNLVSSPGSGKTSLLERTLREMSDEVNFSVIEGDQQTTQDADRIAATGTAVVQVNTGKGCHLDADMVHKAIKKLNPTENSVLMIENVGNLVCPSMFDLGEQKRVVIISVTEGDDKPLKYPTMFETSDICIINKIDLLPYVNFSIEKVKEYALRINHHIAFMELSATTGEGMEQWYQWIREQQLVNA
jgi:hydrogenase nickel incorporation protein HypB